MKKMGNVLLRNPLNGAKGISYYRGLKKEFGEHSRVYQELVSIALTNPLEFAQLKEFDDLLQVCQEGKNLAAMALRSIELIYLEAVQVKGLSPHEYQLLSEALRRINATKERMGREK